MICRGRRPRRPEIIRFPSLIQIFAGRAILEETNERDESMCGNRLKHQ